MSQPVVRSFYRAVKKYPPADRDYLTPRDRRGDPPEQFTEEQKRSWDALSAFDTEEGVRWQHALLPAPGIGKYVVRYDIPEGSGVFWEETLEPGHYDLRGDFVAIRRNLSVT